MSDYAAEPAAPEVAAPEVGGDAGVEPAAPEPQYVTREDYDQLTGAMGQLIELVQSQQQPGQQPMQIDPLADDFQAQLDAYLESKLTPVTQYQQHLQESEGQEQFKDVLHSIQQDKGEFLFQGTPDKAFTLAQQHYPEFAARYGHSDRTAEMAIEKAYEDLRAWEDAVGKAYMEREQNQLATLAGAPRSPAQAGRPAAQQLATVDGGDEKSVLAKYFPQQ